MRACHPDEGFVQTMGGGLRGGSARSARCLNGENAAIANCERTTGSEWVVNMPTDAVQALRQAAVPISASGQQGQRSALSEESTDIIPAQSAPSGEEAIAANALATGADSNICAAITKNETLRRRR